MLHSLTTSARLRSHCPLSIVYGAFARMNPVRACGPVYSRYCSTQRGNEGEAAAGGSRWEGTPRLPYINQKDILKTLETHVSTLPLQHVLLIWGAKSVGKTGALLTKAAEWEKRGHPVIEVDLKGFDGTLDTFTTMLEEATIAALERHQRTLPDALYEQALKDQHLRAWGAASKVLAAKAHVTTETFAPLWQSLPQVVIAYLKTLNPFSLGTPSAKIFHPAIVTGAAVGPWFQSFANYIRARMIRPKTADFVAIFELLEKIAHLQRSRTFLERIGLKSAEAMKPPIVIIREIQRLDHLSDAPELGRKVFSRLFEYFEPRKQGQSLVPIIIETSDCLWARMKQIQSSQETFKAKQMSPWQRGEAEEWLVKRTLDCQPAPIFTQEEFNKIWDFSGGHAGTIYYIHSCLIDGTPLEQVISEYRLEADGIVRAVVGAGDDLAVITKRKDFMQRLRSAGYKLEALNDRSSEMMYFLQTNVLFSDGVIVYPRNKVYEDSIDRYLNVKKK